MESEKKEVGQAKSQEIIKSQYSNLISLDNDN